MESHQEENQGVLPDWSKMPTDILELCCKQLTVPDQLRFGSVCKPWLSCTTDKSNIWVPQTPWLVANDDASSRFVFFSNTDQKHYKIYKPFKPLRGSFIVGSFKGWLLIRSKGKFMLLNPLSRFRIELPADTTIPSFLASKGLDLLLGIASPVAFAMSTCANFNPITIAIATFEGDLIWCNVGDTVWKGYRRGDDSNYGNILFYDDKLYAITRDGNKIDTFKVGEESLVLLNSLAATTSTTDSTQPDGIETEAMDVYLVECGGKVLGLKRYYDNSLIVRSTLYFVILEVQEKGNSPQLVRVNTLDDHILFVADYNCEALHSKNCPGLEGNSICFIGYSRFIFNGAESGQFSVPNGTFRIRVPLDDNHFFTPLWVLPRFVFECDCNCKCNSAMWIRPKKRRRKYVPLKSNDV